MSTATQNLPVGLKRNYRCCGCGKRDGHGPVLKDHLWLLVSNCNQHRLLCIECIERRLGRPITEDDLKDVPYNFNLVFLMRRLNQKNRLDVHLVEAV